MVEVETPPTKFGGKHKANIGQELGQVRLVVGSRWCMQTKCHKAWVSWVGNICFPELQSSAELGLRYNTNTRINFLPTRPARRARIFGIKLFNSSLTSVRLRIKQSIGLGAPNLMPVSAGGGSEQTNFCCSGGPTTDTGHKKVPPAFALHQVITPWHCCVCFPLNPLMLARLS